MTQIRKTIFSPPELQSVTPAAVSVEKPLCPKCSSELARKVATQGKYKGTEFMACAAFPKCRYIAVL
ncbi:MAG: topoisomerase DNA-binding C4 zinc finger domain-containing protein [Pseudomonadota bacterium]